MWEFIENIQLEKRLYKNLEQCYDHQLYGIPIQLLFGHDNKLSNDRSYCMDEARNVYAVEENIRKMSSIAF